MRPRPLALLGCAALAVLALFLPGCGGGGDKTRATTPAGTSAAKPRKAAPAAARNTTSPANCRAQLGSFVDSLETLRRRLATGLTYAQYSGHVEDLRSAYAAIPVARLTPTCLIAVGTPSERALDVYLEAANAWGECLAEAGCTAADVEATLQSEWRGALRPLAKARAGLRSARG